MAEHQDCPVITLVLNHKNFVPKYLNNALVDFASTSLTSRQLLEEKARERFWKESSQCRVIPHSLPVIAKSELQDR